MCRFIQKQGLDRTFVECDNHMWRVDNRKLPVDITVDGGSDWIAIHRNYSRYLVTDRSRFLTGLKRFYEFSLLPAEVHHNMLLYGECFHIHVHSMHVQLAYRSRYIDVLCGLVRWVSFLNFST